jgi:hypothetical protein
MQISALRISQMLLACAAIGILFSLAAIVISSVIAINGTPNHLSGDLLLMIWATGFVIAIPVVWFRMRPKPNNEAARR